MTSYWDFVCFCWIVLLNVDSGSILSVTKNDVQNLKVVKQLLSAADNGKGQRKHMPDRCNEMPQEQYD